jgi:membrane-associated phospholipid phosphatase
MRNADSGLQLALVAQLIAPAMAMPLISATMVGAQQQSVASVDTSKTFFTRRDLAYVSADVAGTAIVSLFDKRIAHWAQQPNVQGSPSRQRLVRNLSNWSGETTLTWAAVLGYGVGRLSHSSTTAEVALHMIEAQALTSVFGQSIRGVLGRGRPSIAPDNPYEFHWGKGFTHYDYRAFPSLHSAAGFVAASVLVTEMQERNAAATWYVAPALYGAAMIPGLTRVHNAQHWASDIVSGAFLGTLFGTRVVRYTHTHGRTKLDRMLLGAAIVPSPSGDAMVMVTINP